MAKISKAMVSISFFGDDLEPEQLTRLLGAHPSKARRKGDRRTTPNGKTRVAREGAWILDYSEEPSPDEIDQQLNGLLDKLTGDTAVWLDLTSRYKARVFCGLFLDVWNEGFSLTESTLKRLSDQNLHIDFDIYTPTDTWYKGHADNAQRE